MKRVTFAAAPFVVTAFALVLGVFASAAQSATKEEEALMQRERDQGQAWIKKDAKFIDEYEAKEYVFTNEDGTLSEKAADMETLKTGTSSFESFGADDMKAMVFGDAAVVVGRATLKGTYLGSPMVGAYRFADTFVKRDGRWQVVASQITRIAKT